MSAKNMTFVAALRDYFEIPSSSMVSEFKALSPIDKDELRALLEGEGYTIEVST